MSRKSYTQAVDDLLTPLGFVKSARMEWTRVEGGYEDVIGLQVIQGTGTVVNVYSLDLVTDAIFDSLGPGVSVGVKYPVYKRLGRLMGPRDRAWRRDRDKPEDLVAAIETYALPFLSRMHDLVGLLGYYSRGVRIRDNPSMYWHALTVYRLGEQALACQLLSRRPRVRDDGVWRTIDAIRDYCGCPPLPARP
jgi:hypothetical protein